LVDVEHLHLVDTSCATVGDGDSKAVVMVGSAVSLDLLYAHFSSAQEFFVEVNTAEDKVFIDKSSSRLEVDGLEVFWEDLLHDLTVCALTHWMRPCSIISHSTAW